MQGWEFTHLLIAHHSFAQSLICSHYSGSGQMSECERFAQDNWANERIARFFEQIRYFSLSLTKNERFAQNSKKLYFLYILYSCFEVFKKIHSFLVSEVSEWLWSLRTNERPWAICSGRSEGMSDREQIAQVAWQKQAIRSEIRWANSQPCPHAKFFLGGEGA